jgi:hypothetical protein
MNTKRAGVILSLVAAWMGLETHLLAGSIGPGVFEYGSEIDPFTTLPYSPDPKAGATLIGLAANVITTSTNQEAHSFPFNPPAGAYPGTDQIFVGSNQTVVHDGYSEAPGKLAGPMVITMDYSSLLSSGQTVASLTLGIAADDFQFPEFGNPFTAMINGVTNSALTSKLNMFDQTGPVVNFFTIGIAPAVLASNKILTLSINEGGDGGDGWAVDFLTIGVTATAAAVPEPSSLALGTIAALVGLGCWRHQSRRRDPV